MSSGREIPTNEPSSDDQVMTEVEALRIEVFLLDRCILGIAKTHERRALIADIDRALAAHGVPVEPTQWRPVEEMEELKKKLLADRVPLVDRYARLRAAESLGL